MPLREARREDIRRIVEMLADDDIARSREDLTGDMASYNAAFDAIAVDPNNSSTVYDAWAERTGGVGGTDWQISIARSTDRG